MDMAAKEMMAKRAAEEIPKGSVVNLGFGIPQKVINYIDESKMTFFHSENGILGAGPVAKRGEEDPDIVDSGCIPIIVMPGASYFDSADSFGLVRCGKLDITILGALEVAENGDLANWMIPGGHVPGMGGAMELAMKAKKVIILTTHMTKDGEPKMKARCTLPLTAKSCVSLVITDIAVFEVTNKGFLLKEIFAGHSVEEIIKKTDAKLIVNGDIRIIDYN